MKAIECKAIVNEDHQALVAFPDDVQPGEHRILIVIDAQAAEADRPSDPDDTDPIAAARGALKGTPLSTKRYFELKEEDKRLER